MKNFFKPGNPENENSPAINENYMGELYVAYLNKEMIESSAADHIDNKESNTNRGYNAALFNASNGSYYYNSDGLPTILSYEDEIMLYDEEIAEYY
jgi:hypothetical protein